MRRDKAAAALRPVLSWAVPVLAPFVLFALALAPARVSGSSMFPYLEDGDYLVCARHLEPGHGDVVLVRDGDRILVKRAIALAGETLAISNGTAYLDGKALYEPYVLLDAGSDMDPVEIPEGHVFVMGDNRYASMDSRDGRIGPVGLDDVIGTLLFRIGA